jgi:type II secretory pathway pseudopilin PulG
MIYQSLFNSMKQLKSDRNGFGLLSLVFLILTISISAITIMTLISPSALTRQNRETAEKAAILRAAIQSYNFSHGGVTGTNPPNADLRDLVTTDAAPCLMDNNPANVTYLFLQGWCGPYIDQVFMQNLTDFKTDGWGTLFSYNPATAVITSCGPDRSCGGADDLVFSP